MDEKALHVDCVFLGHSGFYIELPNAILLFDWYKGDLPVIDKNKPLYIFISHIHNDHFRWDVFNLANNQPHAEIFLGYDHQNEQINKYLDELPEKLQDCISCFDGEQKLFSDDNQVEVLTLRSTDIGVAFIVKISGKTFFHAGDLFLWKRPRDMYESWRTSILLQHIGAMVETYDEFSERCENEFFAYTEQLRNNSIDYAMLPMDPRFGDAAEKTIIRYMDISDIKCWSPMHLWEKYDYIDTFLTALPNLATNMIAVTQRTDVLKCIKEGERYQIPI